MKEKHVVKINQLSAQIPDKRGVITVLYFTEQILKTRGDG